MASTSAEEHSFSKIKHFPPVIDGRINVIEFLAASTDLVAIVERFGSVFAPVKLDMQGNIDKIKKHYKYNENSCIMELMLNENQKGKPTAAEGVLWLNRALLFFEILFREIIANLQAQIQYDDVNMKKIFTIAYEGSIKKYHNWVTQQLFSFICKMSPKLTQIMAALDIKEYETLENYDIALHLVRSKIDDFFKDNNMFNDST